MRSNWKVKPYIKHGYYEIESEEPKLFVRKGFLNPIFYDKRLSIYRGNVFKNFKIRVELVSLPIGSFVLTRPSFDSIRIKFKNLKK